MPRPSVRPTTIWQDVGVRDEERRPRRALVSGSNATRPAASIVVTTYATPASLLEISLMSLLEQTLTDIEVILVVDGDLSESSEAFVAAAAARDPRLVILRPGRVGRARALNVGMTAARSEIVGIQDADDASHPRRLEVQLGLFARVPRLSLLGTAAVITTDLGARADWELPVLPPSVRIISRALLRSNPIVHSSVLARRPDIDRIGGYDECRSSQFYYDLTLRLSSDGAVLGLCGLPLVLHRRHPNQFFEGQAPMRRSWGSYRLQMSHIGDLPQPMRLGYFGVAAGRFGYQVARGIAWHRASNRQRTTPE